MYWRTGMVEEILQPTLANVVYLRGWLMGSQLRKDTLSKVNLNFVFRLGFFFYVSLKVRF